MYIYIYFPQFPMTIDDQIGSKSQPLPQIFPPPPVAG